ncbi:MAG: PASTA domain-containing protein [Lachnospiraceae bacterium]|jgi:stage V sporulation protein D (sporulation-specific penicillin-binding protein)|nr:PASTA domain-containing protein [Lachnospiraceae bacterium]
MRFTDLSQRRRMRTMLIVGFLIFVLLSMRIGFIQLVQGSELQSMAYLQQTLNRKTNPKRGIIYDSTGNVLAMSATVQTITVTPTNIAKENKEKVAKALSEIFGLEYEVVLKKVNKNTSLETIIKKVDEEKADELRLWMNENNILTGINIDEDTKRYYPYNTLAAQVIGFTGSDNQGIEGLEVKYDSVLKGVQGRILKATDAEGGDIEDEEETYVAAIDGDSLVLSIDMTIQSIAEKYLKEACIDNNCTDGGNIVIMNPKTGDVLALASYPTYNLNEPYSPNTDELKAVWDTMESKQKNEALSLAWRNRAIADTYEPGSTFKLVTASAALEEGITSTDNSGEFHCSGSIEVAGVRMKCWRHYNPHGSESLRDALMNSCNPVFIGLGQRLGVEKYYGYLERFGLLSRTGIDLLGEANSILLKENKVGPVELATISFGQRFEITPIQMLTAVSAIANNGVLTKPRVVKEIINSQTGEKEIIEPVQKGRVVSEKTAKDVLSMMGTVVAEGTGKNAQVAGYSIGGKTGTSEDGVNTNKYVASFVGVAPLEDPELSILVTLYNPTGQGGHGGGGVAAPVVSQVLGEVLPYLEVRKNTADEELISVPMPNVVGCTVKEARRILKEKGLEVRVESAAEDAVSLEGYIVTSQVPKEGINVNKGTQTIIGVD